METQINLTIGIVVHFILFGWFLASDLFIADVSDKRRDWKLFNIDYSIANSVWFWFVSITRFAARTIINIYFAVAFTIFGIISYLSMGPVDGNPWFYISAAFSFFSYLIDRIVLNKNRSDKYKLKWFGL